MSTITDLQSAIAGVAERVGPAVVGFGRGWGRGSGVVYGPGRILTSAHNLRGDEVTVAFQDGRRTPGRVGGIDPDLDLAVVLAETGDVEPVAWEPAEATASIGLPVVAVANPGGRGLRATLGFVSAAGRSFRGPSGRRIPDCIEHTAPLPRGSGGGPLVDLDGRLLGLNAVRLDGGLLLAVPAGSTLAERAGRLARGEPGGRPRLGVAIASPRVARRLRAAVGLPEREGVLVRSLEEGSPAQRAGIERGDLIVRAGDSDVDSLDALYRALDAVAPAGRLSLLVLRGADERSVEVEFGAREQEVAS